MKTAFSKNFSSKSKNSIFFEVYNLIQFEFCFFVVDENEFWSNEFDLCWCILKTAVTIFINFCRWTLIKFDFEMISMMFASLNNLNSNFVFEFELDFDSLSLIRFWLKETKLSSFCFFVDSKNSVSKKLIMMNFDSKIRVWRKKSKNDNVNAKNN